ncbi:MAG: protein of unknown function, contains SWIM-type Zinc finger domain [Nitrospira sp.]|nr:protein of unknown function, contains SWIM-type Zinc finger domain [Nitrospira sp.]
MISSVVEPNAFQLGKQYHSERRVQMMDASDTEITSSVMGNSGLYEQTIRLSQGHLEAKCSCTLSEHPICRHGVAALLEYHRWAKAKNVPKVRPVSPYADIEKPKVSASGDVKLSELTQFMEWMQRAVQAIQADHPVPDQPNVGNGEVSTWIQVIRSMDERRRESEAAQAGLDADIRNRNTVVARLTQELDSSVKESKSLQVICKDLQREVDHYRAALNQTADFSRQVEQFDIEVKAIARTLTDKGRRLEGLADTCREVASMLKSLGKT